jgi:hypothetical protein
MELSEKIGTSNTYYIAKALHNKYSDRFVCISIKNNAWYEFKNHRWALSEGGTSLINLICNDFINDFHILVVEYNNKAIALTGSEKEDYQSKASKTQKIKDSEPQDEMHSYTDWFDGSGIRGWWD